MRAHVSHRDSLPDPDRDRIQDSFGGVLPRALTRPWIELMPVSLASAPGRDMDIGSALDVVREAPLQVVQVTVSRRNDDRMHQAPMLPGAHRPPSIGSDVLGGTTCQLAGV